MGKEKEKNSKPRVPNKKNGNKKKQFQKNGASENTNVESTNVASCNSKTNDVSWYMHNPQLVNDAARIPFGNQLGRKLTGKLFGTINCVPGVCAIKVVPGPGIAESVNDAVNISATNIFQYIRKNLSTYSSYHAADVMMYIMAVDELFAWYNYLVRLFGIANNFSATNLYYPKALLLANGMSDGDITAFRENMNDYRARFNSLIYKAASIYMPVDISIVRRHMWMYGNYFVDSETAKAQTYIYVPAGYHILDETSNENGTMMKYHALTEGFGVPEALEAFDAMIESIRGSDSMLKIAADMRRAYESSQAWTLAYIPENMVIMPIKDDNVLHQIMNSVIHSKAMTDTCNFDITQSVERNKIIYKPTAPLPEDTSALYTSFANASETDGIIINFFKEAVTAEDIVEATRNISLFRVDGENITFYTSGADICVDAVIYVKNPGATGEFEMDEYHFYTYQNMADAPAHNPITEYMALLHAFDWVPNVYLCKYSTNPTFTPFINFDNYTQVNGDTMHRLNENVLTSMWQVPDFRLPTQGKK